MRLLAPGIVLLAVCALISVSLPPKARELATTPLPRPELARLASGEFTGLASDSFLIQSAVFYGSRDKLRKQESRWLGNALELAQSLDPYYREPYWMAGSVLPWQDRPEKALAILREGRRHRPRDWEIPFHIGFIQFHFLDKPLQAADSFERASSLPGSPEYLPLLASRLRAQKDQKGTAIAFLRKQLERTEDPMLRRRMKKRLKALTTMRALERKVDEYQERFGHPPEKLQDLVRKELLKKIPPDPYGGKYYLDDDQQVQTTSELR